MQNPTVLPGSQPATGAVAGSTTAPKLVGNAAVQNLFKSSLGRQIDQNSLDFWGGHFQNGMSLADIQNHLRQSKEGQAYASRAQANMIPDLDPWQAEGFAQQRNRVRQGFGNQLAAFDARRGFLDQDATVGRANLTRGWQRARHGLMDPFAARGLMNSGIMQRGFQQFGEDRTESFDALDRDYGRQTAEMAMQRQQAEQMQAQALQDIERQEMLARQRVAAQIREIM